MREPFGKSLSMKFMGVTSPVRAHILCDLAQVVGVRVYLPHFVPFFEDLIPFTMTLSQMEMSKKLTINGSLWIQK